MIKFPVPILAAMLLLVQSVAIADRTGVENVGNVRFTIITPQLIRIEQSSNGKFIDAPSVFAVNRGARFKNYNMTSKSGEVTINTGVIKITYKPDSNALGPDNLQAAIRDGRSTVVWKPGMENKGNLGGTERTLDRWNGARQLSDGVISRDGWYLLDDSTRHLLTSDWVEQRPKDAGTDWYLFGYGHNYKAALESLTTIGGPVPLPRKYALGAWYSRYWPYSSDDYRKIVAEYSQHDFPLDVMVMDMDWHKDGWTGWSWNRKLLPDAEDLLKWYHTQNLAVTLNVHPADGIAPHEDMYADFMTAMGKDPKSGETIPYDAGDKHYLDTLFKYTHEPLEKEGVDFWWLDWQQYPYTRSIPDLTNLFWLNTYYYNHSRQDGKRGLSFSRWAGWGDHRHPIHFSGDSYTDWKMLAAEVPFTSTAGNVGCFFWSHDIGGHMGDRNEESYARWCQFGATTAALRSHSTRKQELDRRPWTYPKWAEDSMRISFHLRSELFPYIYSSAWQSCRQSIPLNRPMYIDYPNIEQAYSNGQQYLFGDDMIVAPITIAGTGPKRIACQSVWLPEGLWYNWFSGEQYKGSQEILTAATIDEFPIFARGGVPIPLQPYTQRMTSAPLTTLVVRCYPGSDGKVGKSVLYEDDGITEDYKQGKSATTQLSYERNGFDITVRIAPTKGTYNGQVKNRGYRIELPDTTRAMQATVDGKFAAVIYSTANSTNIVEIPARSIRSGTVVMIRTALADFEQIRIQSIVNRTGITDNGAKNVKDLLKTALPLVTSPEQKSTLLGACGIGLIAKNSNPYLYPVETAPKLFAPADIVDSSQSAAPDKAQVTIAGQEISLDCIPVQGP